VVQVSVQAIDPLGGALHYQWRSTDGRIVDQDSPTTTWTMASGGGLHFAYVLVSNGKGAYVQRRVAVVTDQIGKPAIVTAPQELRPPLSNPPQGNSVYAMVGDDGRGPFLENVHLTDIDGANPTQPGQMDLRGFVTIYGVPTGDWIFPCDLFDGPFSVKTNCNGSGTADHKFTLMNESFAGLGWAHFTANERPPPQAAEINYGIRLRDGTVPGINNEFFGIASTAVASLLATNGLPSSATMPARTSSGNIEFYFPNGLPSGLTSNAKIQIEGAQPVQAALGDLVTNMDSTLPAVTDMQAFLAGTNVGVFLPPPAAVGPRHEDARKEDVFLTAKGIDSRQSAWKYYQAIGAITDYDAANDRPIGGITFDDWKRHTRMDPYAQNGKHDVTATYINRVDLNLTRAHHSISYGSNAVAAYVCNFLGPAADTQVEVNKAINNAVNGRNLVACVAMDHTVTPGVNGGRPFTRFLIFGPNGRLLPSINLDGEGEKFVPGSCVACHGGDHYAGSFQTTGTPSPDIGAHFLPYDTGNFSFATNSGLTEVDEESSIHQLNLNVLDAGPTPIARELIAGWYQNGTGVLDKEYVPPSYTGKSTNAIAFYKQIYAQSCRTCHVAMSEPGNFDHFQNLIQKTEPYHNYLGYDRISFFVPQTPGGETFNSALMPNSLRTFSLLMADPSRLEIYWNLLYELDAEFNQ
jgi:mono/diheme cytochrome c family protein